MKQFFLSLEGFEWDLGNIDHIKKHLVLPKECEEVFANKPIIVSNDKLHSKTEKRFYVLGKTILGRKLVVVFTKRRKQIRIVSARDQNKKERLKYEKQEVKYAKEKI
jgi:uncharacterized DUF497 family protein